MLLTSELSKIKTYWMIWVSKFILRKLKLSQIQFIFAFIAKLRVEKVSYILRISGKFKQTTNGY